jgi:hypothetical protein
MQTRRLMNRLIDRRSVPAIVEAKRMLPPAILRLVRHADFLCGVDPHFTGISEYVNIVDGRSYRDTAHVLYPMHQWSIPKSRRAPTVCLPAPEEPWSIVHELGHILHEVLMFEPYPKPVCDYAATNFYEAFARAFDAWVLPYVWPEERDRLEEDRETVMLFRNLSR